jgi:phage-related baseplate assembly protein
MEAPQFISVDVNQVQADLVSYFEQLTGRTLQPAAVERLILNAVAYRELLIRQSIQDAAQQNLVDFSSAPVIDYLGALVGVERLAATPAQVDIRFTLVADHTGVTIPAGTRVMSTDGKAVFATVEAANVVAGVTTVTVVSEAQVAGVVANGYNNGTVTVILDPQAFIISATNTSESSGGSAQESDEELRDRIKLAPGSFSNAGSYGAYKFHAKSAHPSIIDVAVVSPQPGDVLILPLMFDGSETPEPVIDAVYAACNDERIRPLTDLVIVESPERVEYEIEVNLTLLNTADGATVTAAVQAALDAYITGKRQSMGQDIVGTQIIDVCHVTGVYSVALVSFTDIVITEVQFGFCTGTTINITSYVEG